MPEISRFSRRDSNSGFWDDKGVLTDHEGSRGRRVFYPPKFDVSEKANAPSAGGGVNGDVESLDYTVGLASSADGSGLM